MMRSISIGYQLMVQKKSMIKLEDQNRIKLLKKNIIDYFEKNGTKAFKDIWITMTINSQNYHTICNVIKEWRPYSNKIGFQFHTPFTKGDSLWMPFGMDRSKIIVDIISMR